MRRVPLRAQPAADYSGEPGYREWSTPSFGRCAACGKPGPLQRHHVVALQHCRVLGAPLFDLRDSMLLGFYCRCHRDHTSAASRISVRKIPDEAIAFTVELYGERAGAYLSRYYAP